MDGNPNDVDISAVARSGEIQQVLQPGAAEQPEQFDSAKICEGCAKLSVRVTLLEEQFAQLSTGQMAPAARPLGTTTCYWIVVGLHGFILMCMLTGVAAMLAYPFLLGALGTLAACHSLPVRPVLMKWARTLLSATVVCLCALLPLRLLGALDAQVLSLVLIGLPLVLAPALFGSQLAVWIVGWRVLPPGTIDSNKIRFRIVDILGATVVAALYAALFQFASFDELNVDFSDGGWLYLGLILFACLMVGVVGALFARSLLVVGPKVSKIWFFCACLTVVLSTVMLVSVFFLQGDVSSGELNTLLLSLLLYAGVGSLVCSTSPVFTFLLMRVAGYRLATFSTLRE